MKRLIALALASAVLCSGSTAPALADEKIRVLAPTWVGFAPALVAAKLG